MGLKSKKVKAGAVRRDIVRTESRWVRRLLHQHRRFARWMKKHKLPWDPMNRNYADPAVVSLFPIALPKKSTVNRKDLYNRVMEIDGKDCPEISV